MTKFRLFLLSAGLFLVPSLSLAASITVTPNPVISQASMTVTTANLNGAGGYQYVYIFDNSSNSVYDLTTPVDGINQALLFNSIPISGGTPTLANSTYTIVMAAQDANIYVSTYNSYCGLATTYGSCLSHLYPPNVVSSSFTVSVPTPSSSQVIATFTYGEVINGVFLFLILCVILIGGVLKASSGKIKITT